MRKHIFRIAILLAGAAIAGSCTKNVEYTGEGRLTLSVAMSSETKAAMTEDELLSSANIKIYKSDFSGKVREYTYSSMPSTLYLPADGYRIDVTAGEVTKSSPAVASWEQKSYKGSQEVTVTASSTTTANVVATVSNVVTKVSFDSSIAELFESGYTCTIGLDKEDASQQLVYDSSNSGTDGFFIAEGFEPSLYWTFSGTLKKDGSAFTKSGEISSVEQGKRYVLGLKYTETDGMLTFSLEVDDTLNEVYDDIIFEATSTGVAATPRYDVWAGHFIAYADVDESEYDNSSVRFEYRAVGSTTWLSKDAGRDSEGSFSAVIDGLSPETEYEYRLVVTPVGSSESETIAATSNITTDVATPIPNGSFETTSNAESSSYKSLYDPSSSDPTLTTKWWCSGNAGSTAVGSSGVICYPDASNYKDGSQSICLESKYVIIKFAAGNLFSGRFGGLVGTSGGKVYFGRPFTARPTAVRFWYKYSGGQINRTTSNTPSDVHTGDYDKASIRVAVGNWDYKTYGGDATSPILVNTTDESTFVDYSTDASTIALGELIVTSDASNSTNTWQYVTIPIKYNSTTKYPTHIVVSCASSMYGDYFTGCDSSKLWLDGMELLYE